MEFKWFCRADHLTIVDQESAEARMPAAGTKIRDVCEVQRRCGAAQRSESSKHAPYHGVYNGDLDMGNQSTICLLSDADLDAVTGGRHGGGGGRGGGNTGTIVEIVEISIGEIVAAATGNSIITINLAGLGNNATANTSFRGNHRH